jgi:hypothetical protein
VIGPYPDGTATAPAAMNVIVLRDAFATWNSGSSGMLVIDVGGRSGTLSVDLSFAGWQRSEFGPLPTTVLPTLHLEGSWLCPAGT